MTLLLSVSAALNAIFAVEYGVRALQPVQGSDQTGSAGSLNGAQRHPAHDGRLLTQMDTNDECTVEQRELHRINSAARKQYSNDYWAWQSNNVIIGGQITALLFAPFVSDNMSAVADIGCGSGTVVNNLHVADKWCVEVNPFARAHIGKTLPHLTAVDTVDRLPNGRFDLIISNHALEHTPCPLLLIAQLRHKLKRGGRLVITVPGLQDELVSLEEHHRKTGTYFKPAEQHHHLYVWGPQQLGNLFKVAGYDVIDAKIKKYSRTQAGDDAWKTGGAAAFWRIAERENRHPQTMVVAQRPAA